MMKTQEQLAGVHITSLIGQQGTGKTTLAQALATKLHGQFIEASDVVSKITGVTARGEMYKTNIRTKQEPGWLGKGIAEAILVSGNWCHGVFLSGVREEENHDYLRSLGATIRIVTLWCPENERFVRVKNNGKVEHYKDFVKHGQAELSIGLHALLEKYPPQYVTTYHTIDEIVDRILEREVSIH